MALPQLREWLLAPYCDNNSQLIPQLHRRMLVISGSDEFCDAALSNIRTLTDEVASIRIAIFSGDALKGKKRKQVLGVECDIALLDCRYCFKPGDVMAVAGIVKRSGCLILICPEFNEWVENISVPFLSEGFTLNHSRYLSRFIENLRKNPYMGFHTETKTVLPGISIYGVEQESIHTEHTNAHFRSVEQEYAYNQLHKAYMRNHLNALVTAPRGRGKSSLLGLFIDSLVREGKRVLLTSERIENVTNVLSRFTESEDADDLNVRLGTSQVASMETQRAEQQTMPKGLVKWVPPDSELLFGKENKNYDLVIVDEAASMPLPVINRIIAYNPQWVLSTTLLGYEGSGRGFIHKLIPNLPNGTLHLTLTTPLRWFENDPIEAFFNNTCLFENYNLNDVDGTVYSESSSKDISAILGPVISPELIATCEFNIFSFEKINEGMLLQIMSLLSLAHYQTTPDDFMRLMDSPDVLVASFTINGFVLAVAIINVEGGSCLSDAAFGIATGKRRPKGHLGAQRLTLLSADVKAATQRYWRINRIAVHPNLQNKGIGSQLVKQIVKEAHKRAIDAISTSYGTTNKLDGFWSNNGFEIVDYGRKPNKASGETSALAVLPLNKYTGELVKKVVALKASFISAVNLLELPNSVLEIYINKLNHFTQGTRTLDDIWPILSKLASEAKLRSKAISDRHETKRSNGTELRNANLYVLNKLIKIMNANSYIVSLFEVSNMNMTLIKEVLEKNSFKVNGVRGSTAAIRAILRSAFE
ncbi:tRNA(Met) cytidine acetyltransferase [Alteromonas sp. IB21]|uniref:GNAT family N-acetyltransferase n=1 Tax=Alteromonas sp. IB21 TaxID=2779369 RepID=UPI0018E6E246|nr:GNAT family N-acetyltransferase [Alteromonas sp. IB21]MBJ2127494.1 tRNA(Met) cytidine acetyltransferase [Alteromonas sp. IB21]